MKKYNLIKNALKEGQKITLVSQGEFGGMYSVLSTYYRCEQKEHYLNCPDNMIGVKIIHKPKSKQKFYETSLSYCTPLVIYDGWITINIDEILYKIIHSEDGILTKESRYTMFDNNYFYDLIELYPNAILVDIQ